jgi:hypothetical protein
MRVGGSFCYYPCLEREKARTPSRGYGLFRLRSCDLRMVVPVPELCNAGSDGVMLVHCTMHLEASGDLGVGQSSFERAGEVDVSDAGAERDRVGLHSGVLSCSGFLLQVICLKWC